MVIVSLQILFRLLLLWVISELAYLCFLDYLYRMFVASLPHNDWPGNNVLILWVVFQLPIEHTDFLPLYYLENHM